MQTLSNGYLKPETNDKGPVVFPALEGNIQKLNDHTHDGSNSEPINAFNITKGSVAVDATSWSLHTNGYYRKLVTLPGSYSFDDCFISVYFDGGTYDGEKCSPLIEKVSSTTFYLYSPVNSQAFDVVIA